MRDRSRRNKPRCEDCLQKDLENWFNVKKVSDKVGDGLFTKVSFFKGDFLLFYRGKRLSEN